MRISAPTIYAICSIEADQRTSLIVRDGARERPSFDRRECDHTKRDWVRRRHSYEIAGGEHVRADVNDCLNERNNPY